MFLVKLRQNKAMAFAEYAMLISIMVGVMAMVSVLFIKGLRGKTAKMADVLLGPPEDGGFLPMNADGGKQLASQTNLYGISGITDKATETNVGIQEKGMGERHVLLFENQVKVSPGAGQVTSLDGLDGSMKPLPDFHYEDNDAVPVYIPPFVGADEGVIQPPTSD